MLVTMKEILLHAKENNYGVTAPNIQMKIWLEQSFALQKNVMPL